MKRGAVIGLVAGGVVLALASGVVASWLSGGSGPADEGARPSASVSPTASIDPTAAVQEQLDRYADACAAPATSVPRHCGIVIPWAADLSQLSGLAFRIEAYPVVVLSPDGRSFDATGGVLVATATGTTREGTPSSVTYRTDEWALRGDIITDGDDTTVSVR